MPVDVLVPIHSPPKLSYFFASSISCNFRQNTLPVPVLGSSVTNSTTRGYL